MNCKKIKINEKDIIFSHAKVNSYIEGLSVITRKLSQIEDVNIVFSWVKMKEKTYVVSRSDDAGVDISKILTAVGGGGHPQAASAVVKDLSFKEIENKIIHSLKENIKKPLTAKDIMSYPVRVINEDEKIIKVSNVLKKYGHSGIPIVNSKGSLAGIITRKDVDKAINHGLGHAPVKGFKSSGIITAGPNTTIDEIQRMMIENGIGRIPIIKGKEIAGIVTRKDILRFLHGQRFYITPQKDFNYHTSEIKEKITSLFTEEINDILKNVSMAAKELKINAYLVGGIVRDILLGMPNFDIDIVVEGDGIGFAKKLSKKLGCRMNSHKKFNTAVLVLGDGQHIDIATSRIEFYKRPGALPSVEWGSIGQDLSRRDFTINAMALSLNEKNFGQILDFFGGRKDLNDKRVKILHKMSFIEDPTRIFRAVRFEQRLGFEMDKQTEKLVRSTIEMDVVSELTGVRIRDELISILNEEKPWKPIKRLYELGALKKIGLDTKIDLSFVNQIKSVLNYYEKLIDFARNDIKKWRIIIILLLSGCKIDYIKKWCFKMKIKKRDINIIVDTIEKFKSAEDSLKKIIQKNFNLYKIVSSLPKELMVILSSQNESCYKNIKKYLSELSDIKLSINGNTIKDLGFKPSKNFKIVLDRLFELKLDGKIKSKDEEIHKAKLLMDKVE
jgi:tRNA nucleotidyltransferase (CCA-adding enzyme)